VDGVTGQATARPEDPVRAPGPPPSEASAPVGPRRRPGGAVGVLRDPVLAGRLTRLTVLAARARIRRRFLVDAGMLGLGAVIAGFYDLSITSEGLPWAILFVVLTFVNLKARGLYAARLRASPLDDLSRILAATSTAAILVVGARVAADSVNGASVQAVRLWVASTILLSAGRLAIAAVVARRQRAGVGQLRTLIIGADAVGAQIARRLTDQPELGLRAVGFVDERPGVAAGHAPGGPPLLGTPSDLEAVVHGHGIRHVIVGFAAVPPHRLTAAVRTCRRLGVGVSTVPRLYEDVNTRLEVEHLGGIPLLSSRPSDLHGWQVWVKHGLDRAVAGLLLVLLSPLLLVIAVAVRLSSPGPVLYRQPRVSLDGREFTMLKFRTMVGAGERDGHADAQWAARTVGAPAGPERESGEDRSTRIGRVLRSTSLDEVPQLLNVLRGEMSLVGPRPERSDYARLFGERVYRYADRHRVRSGLTGWAQVHGLRGETSLADRVEWDNYYIENWTLWLDLKILLLTVPAVLSWLRGRGFVAADPTVAELRDAA
jgi:exopolysaccharide biosynthesis polyprenyl glycosylphosphotransferase